MRLFNGASGRICFIIATLGLSLGVISKFLYPVVVAVSVITTFLTPYMIRGAEPTYNFLLRHMPKQWVRRVSHIDVGTPQNYRLTTYGAHLSKR